MPSPALAQVAPNGGQEPYEWDHVFPLMGKALAQRGITFPKPWGLGVNYAYANQLIEISDMEVAVNDSEFVNLDDVIVFGDVRSQVHIVNLRLDLWLFPFLNIYTLGNYVAESQTDTHIVSPVEFTAGAVQPGAGGGFGTTFAFGFLGFFGTVDLNWTWNQMQKLENPVSTFLLTPRVGKNFGKLGPINLVVWVGGMRQAIGSKTEGSIRLRDTIDGPSDEFVNKVESWYDGLGPAQKVIFNNVVDQLQGVDPTIHYRMRKKLESRWNMTVGTEVGFTKNLFLRAEFGFIGRTQFIAGLNYRFDGLPAKTQK